MYGNVEDEASTMAHIINSGKMEAKMHTSEKSGEIEQERTTDEDMQRNVGTVYNWRSTTAIPFHTVREI